MESKSNFSSSASWLHLPSLKSINPPKLHPPPPPTNDPPSISCNIVEPETPFGETCTAYSIPGS